MHLNLETALHIWGGDAFVGSAIWEEIWAWGRHLNLLLLSSVPLRNHVVLGARHSYRENTTTGPFEHFKADFYAIQLNTSTCKEFSFRFSTIDQLFDGSKCSAEKHSRSETGNKSSTLCGQSWITSAAVNTFKEVCSFNKVRAKSRCHCLMVHV